VAGQKVLYNTGSQSERPQLQPSCEIIDYSTKWFMLSVTLPRTCAPGCMMYWVVQQMSLHGTKRNFS